MIRVHVRLKDGLLESFSAEGHAEGGLKGTNIQCAAVTMLLRTVARAVGARKDVESRAGTKGPGDLTFVVSGFGKDEELWLSGVTDVLLAGLSDLEREYPEDVSLTTSAV